MIPSDIADSIRFFVGFGVALLCLWTIGRALLRWAQIGSTGWLTLPIVVAQPVVLILGYAYSGVNHLVHRVSSEAMPLAWCPWGLFAVSALYLGLSRAIARGAGESPSSRRLGYVVWWAAVLMSLGLMLATCSQSLAALGLDTHQHLYWTNQIVDLGFVPLRARFSDVIEPYPHGLHLMVALWTAASGASVLSGAMLKMMPFMQLFIACTALFELFIGPAATKGRGRWTWHLLPMALFLPYYALNVANMPYPISDLNGTGRLTVAAIQAAPLLCWLALRGTAHRRARLLGLSLLLTMPLLAFEFNPAAGILSLLFYLPLTLCCVPVRPFWLALRQQLGPAAFFTVMAALLLLLQDPWVIQNVAAVSPRAELQIAHVFHAQRSVQAKVLSTTDQSPGPLRPGDLPVLYEELKQRLVAANASKFSALKDKFTKPQRLDSLAVGLLLSAILLSLLPRGLQRRQVWTNWLLFGRLLLGMSIGGLVLFFVTTVLGHVARSSFFLNLLTYYLDAFGSMLAMIMVYWLAAVAYGICLSALAPEVALTFKKKPQPVVMAATALALYYLAQIGLTAYKGLATSRLRESWTAPVSRNEIMRFRRLEARIPEHDRILVGATHATLNEEHWIVPIGAATSLLPYGRKAYVFNAFLGAGATLTWGDLDRGVCHGDADTKAFFQAKQIRWLLVRGEAADASGLKSLAFCNRSADDLGAKHEGVLQDGDLYFYPL